MAQIVCLVIVETRSKVVLVVVADEKQFLWARRKKKEKKEKKKKEKKKKNDSFRLCFSSCNQNVCLHLHKNGGKSSLFPPQFCFLFSPHLLLFFSLKLSGQITIVMGNWIDQSLDRGEQLIDFLTH